MHGGELVQRFNTCTSNNTQTKNDPLYDIKQPLIWGEEGSNNKLHVAYHATRQQMLEATDDEKLKEELHDNIQSVYTKNVDEAYTIRHNVKEDLHLESTPDRDKVERPYKKRPETSSLGEELDKYLARGVFGPSMATAAIPPQPDKEVYILKRPHVDRKDFQDFLRRRAKEDGRSPSSQTKEDSLAEFANTRYELYRREKLGDKTFKLKRVALSFQGSDKAFKNETAERAKKDFNQPSRTKYLLKVASSWNGHEKKFRWLLDSAASDTYLPMLLLHLLVNVRVVNQRVKVGNNAYMDIPYAGQLVLPNGTTLDVKIVKNMSVCLIGVGALAKALPGWKLTFDNKTATASQRSHCECETKAETVINKTELGTLVDMNLYETDPERLASFLLATKMKKEEATSAAYTAKHEELPKEEVQNGPQNNGQNLTHLEGKVAYFTHLSTVVQRDWMHRTFLHRQRLDHGWFGDSIINRPKIPNRRSICKCGVCAMAKAKLRQSMLDKMTEHVAKYYCQRIHLDYIPDLTLGLHGARNLLILVETLCHDIGLQPMRKRAEVIRAFDAMMAEKLKTAKKIFHKHMMPKTRWVNGVEYLQVEEIITDNDSTMTATKGWNLSRDNAFKKHVKLCYGADVRPGPAGEQVINGKVERVVQEVKTTLKIMLMDCPLKLKYWVTATYLLQRIWYLLPQWANHGNASPLRILEARSCDFEREIKPYYMPFGTVVVYALTKQQVKAKAFSIWGIKGGIGHYLGPSRTTRWGIRVLIGNQIFDMSPRQLCADYKPTHSFRSPIENITWRRGQRILLPDERVKCTLEKSINGFVIKPAIEHVPDKSDIKTLPEMLVKEIKNDGPHLRVYNEDRTELFTIDKKGNILMRQPTKYFEQKQSLLPSTADEALLQGTVKIVNEIQKTKRKESAAKRVALNEVKAQANNDDSKTSLLEADIWDFEIDTPVELEVPGEKEGKGADKQLKHLLQEGRNFQAPKRKLRNRTTTLEALKSIETKNQSVSFKNACSRLGQGFSKFFKRKKSKKLDIFHGVIAELEKDAREDVMFPLRVTYPEQSWQKGYIDSEAVSMKEVRHGHDLFTSQLKQGLIEPTVIDALVEIKSKLIKELREKAKTSSNDQEQKLFRMIREEGIEQEPEDVIEQVLRDKKKLNKIDMTMNDIHHIAYIITEEQEIKTQFGNKTKTVLKTEVSYAPKRLNDIANILHGHERWGVAGPNKIRKYGGATFRESQRFQENKCFKVVELKDVPRRDRNGRKTRIYQAYFLYKYKMNNAEHMREKARMVICGTNSGATASQKYSPTITDPSLKLQIASNMYIGNTTVFSFDLASAFTQCEMPPDIEAYFRAPKGLLDENSKPYPRGTILKLLRSHYGLYFASKLLWEKLSNILLDYGFKMGSDKCTFSYFDNEANRYISVSLYVDDALVMAKTERDCRFVMALFWSKGMKLTGEFNARRHCGYDIKYYRNKRDGTKAMALSMQQYTAKLRSKYQDKVNESKKPRKLPANPRMSEKDFEKVFLLDQNLYRKEEVTRAREFVGSVMFLACRTGYDIAAAVSRLARTMTKPSKLWHESASWLMQYIHTESQRMPALIYYEASKAASLNPILAGMSDSSWRSTSNNRSMMSNICMLGWGKRWSLISHSSSLSVATGLSTGEAESYGLCRQMVTLQGKANLQRQEGFKCQPHPSGDNTCSLINAITGKQNMLHMPHFTQHTHDVIVEKLCERPEHVNTFANWSDVGTKALKDANDFAHKISYILTSTCSKEWNDEWEEIEDKEYSRVVTMRMINDECASFGLTVSQKMIDYLNETEKKEVELKSRQRVDSKVNHCLTVEH